MKNKQNIILLGNIESGLTQIAKRCDKYFNTIKGPKDGKVSICYCTKNIECTELIGMQKLENKYDKDELIFEWTSI